MFHWLRCTVRWIYREWKYYQHDAYVPIRAAWFDENRHGFDRPL